MFEVYSMRVLGYGQVADVRRGIDREGLGAPETHLQIGPVVST